MPKTSTILKRLEQRTEMLLKAVVECDYDSMRMGEAIGKLADARQALEQARMVRQAQGD